MARENGMTDGSEDGKSIEEFESLDCGDGGLEALENGMLASTIDSAKNAQKSENKCTDINSQDKSSKDEHTESVATLLGPVCDQSEMFVGEDDSEAPQKIPSMSTETKKSGSDKNSEYRPQVLASFAAVTENEDDFS